MVDLNLDQVIDGILRGRRGWGLRSLYLAAPESSEVVAYRQAVFSDLEDHGLHSGVRDFAGSMDRVRRYLHLSSRVESGFHRWGWLLHAALQYCDAVDALQGELAKAAPDSPALSAARKWLRAYTSSSAYTTLLAETRRVASLMATVEFVMDIRGREVEIRRLGDEPDYGECVCSAFEDLRRDARRSFVSRRPTEYGLSYLEIQLAECIEKLYPGEIASLADFARKHADFVDEGVVQLDREFQFYMAYLDYIRPLQEAGHAFCYPAISPSGSPLHARGTFDLLLAKKLHREGSQVVPNDFSVDAGERILVITGANQGGKTTFARMIGQIHYLAALGCPVPGEEARLMLFDKILTHFEREERIEDLRGKMEDDLLRIDAILRQTTPRTIVIMNEMFTSATLTDERLLGESILRRIDAIGCIGVCVTFIEELAEVGDSVVSFVAEVSTEDPTIRTYRIRKRHPDGRAYALSIAKKYRLTRRQIRGRLR